jgi:membrane protease YdiL (CAAX protease family)
MQLPGAASLLFLVVILVLVPLGAMRSARQLRELVATEGRLTDELRSALLASTLIVQGALLVLAWLVGKGIPLAPTIFKLPAVGDWLAAVAALGVLLFLWRVSDSIRSADERRHMLVFQLAPRTRRDWTIWWGVSLMAGTSEEIVYRGVTMTILANALGNPWAAALIASIAFAAAHATQGWKSGLIIFAMALVMHALVAFTGTLILAMAVHAGYDLIAGWLTGREAKAMDLTRNDLANTE